MPTVIPPDRLGGIGSVGSTRLGGWSNASPGMFPSGPISYKPGIVPPNRGGVDPAQNIAVRQPTTTASPSLASPSLATAFSVGSPILGQGIGSAAPFSSSAGIIGESTGGGNLSDIGGYGYGYDDEKKKKKMQKLDTVNAKLRPGEFVLSPEATQMAGPNNLSNFQNSVNRAQHFALGGRVGQFDANTPVDYNRLQYEQSRQPGMAAFGDPHSQAAQNYAAQTNAGIKTILGGGLPTGFTPTPYSDNARANPNPSYAANWNQYAAGQGGLQTGPGGNQVVNPLGNAKPAVTTTAQASQIAPQGPIKLNVGGQNLGDFNPGYGADKYGGPTTGGNGGAANPEDQWMIDTQHGPGYFGLTNPSPVNLNQGNPIPTPPNRGGQITPPPPQPPGGTPQPPPTGAVPGQPPPSGNSLLGYTLPNGQPLFDPRLNNTQPQYQSGGPYDQGLPPLQTRTSLNDIVMSPAYQLQQSDQDKALNRYWAARGRWNSTASLNNLRDANARLLAGEVDRQDQQQYQRNLQINDLLYNRRFQQQGTNFAQDFATNQKDFGQNLQLAQMALQAQYPQLSADMAYNIAQIVMGNAVAQGQAQQGTGLVNAESLNAIGGSVPGFYNSIGYGQNTYGIPNTVNAGVPLASGGAGFPNLPSIPDPGPGLGFQYGGLGGQYGQS